MENEVNNRKISDYFDLPNWSQSQRNTAYKQEDENWKPSIALASDKYHFGIEVEVEGVPEPFVRCKHRSYWDITQDNSLRNAGVEFVSVPLRGDQVENAVRQLQQSLPESHEFSPRTSVHVHMNVRDLQINQIMNLMLVYTVVEELLFGYAGDNRQQNVFCVRITDTEYVRNYRNFQIDPRQVVHYWNKYTALNLLPMESKGTVEFRHMAGTIDPEKIVNWVNLLACIKTYAKNTPITAILQQVHMLNSSSMYEIFLDEVFGKWAHLLMPKNHSLQEKMENAISYVKLANIPKIVQEEQRAPTWANPFRAGGDIFANAVEEPQEVRTEVAGIAGLRNRQDIIDELLDEVTAIPPPAMPTAETLRRARLHAEANRAQMDMLNQIRTTTVTGTRTARQPNRPIPPGMFTTATTGRH